MKFVVYGTPVPQGSMRAFMPKGKHGRPIVTSDNSKLKPWRQEVSLAAIAEHAHMAERHVAVMVTMQFYFARPASAKNRACMVVRPDLDKLVRGVFDALTGILYVDDAQIVEHTARKRYGTPERVEIEVIGV